MYYYLVASLPPLVLGTPAPFTPEEFRFNCQGVLSKPHLDELDAILAGNTRDSTEQFTMRWHDIDTEIRNVCARIRAGREGIDESPYTQSVTEYSVAVEHSVTDALSKANPMEQELALDRVRWRALEELGKENSFGLDAALAFALKLRIAMRWSKMTEEAGREYVEDFIHKNTHEIIEDYKVHTA